MNPPGNDLLLLAGKVITLVIQGAMAIAAVAIALTIPATLLLKDSINADAKAEFGPGITALPIPELMLLLASVLVLVALAFLFFGKLRGIIQTVADGDPFVPANADRLNAMAWLQIGIYVIGLAAGAASVPVARWASQFTEINAKTSLDVDVPSILLAFILFILARVFRHGAAMREDLEGTV